MMQITRQSSPRRGPVLPLAPAPRRSSGRYPGRWPGLSLGLALGAALMLSGCGDDDSSTTTPAPAPAPAPAPPTPAAPDPVGVPGGLKVTASGADFLEFGWDAVEGATAYEIQMSLKEGDFATVATATVTTTMHRFEVAAETTGYARVRTHEGERQSEWSGTAMGTSMAAPLVLSAPRARVKGAGPDYIEWEWDAVANAESYQVRVAATMAGLDAASPETVGGTTHRVDAEPEMEMYLRVRAAAGPAESPVVSDWSDAVAGMSEAAPTPFVVSMRPPEADADKDCSGQAFCPDSGTDAKTAMASVNQRMLVSSSVAARITPMFVEGAAGAIISAGDDQMPFSGRTWSALQSEIATDGVTFEFRRLTVGAGQEPVATGEAAYLTCGPFRCSEAAAETPEAPPVTLGDAAVCTDFEADFELVTGLRMNGNHLTGYNGVDIAWRYTISHPATVTHEFSGVYPDGGDLVVPGAALSVASRPQFLDMRPGTGQINKFGRSQNYDGNLFTALSPAPLRSGPADCFPANGYQLETTTYQSAARSLGRSRESHPVDRPPSCVRLVTDGTYVAYPANEEIRQPVVWKNYVPDYRLRVTPTGGVSWAGSRVEWGEDDPFEDLDCEPETIEVAERLGDVCEAFQAEVDAYWGNGLGAGGAFEVQYLFRMEDVLTPHDENDDGGITHIVVRNKNPITSGNNSGHEYRARGSRHAQLWLVNDGPPRTLAQFNTDAARLQSGMLNPAASEGMDGTFADHDLYEFHRTPERRWGALERTADHVQDGNCPSGTPTGSFCFGTLRWRALMSVAVHDEDGDPRYGDLGKIDMVGANNRPGSDGDPENYDGNADADRCSDADGPGCDAEDVEVELSATFTRIRDTKTCTREIEVSLTCDWDADGDRRRGGDTAFDTDETNDNRFITCRGN